jgi:hypothetical protein
MPPDDFVLLLLVNMNRLRVTVGQKTLTTPFTTDPALFMSGKIAGWCRLLRTVDPDGPNFQLPTN